MFFGSSAQKYEGAYWKGVGTSVSGQSKLRHYLINSKGFILWKHFYDRDL